MTAPSALVRFASVPSCGRLRGLSGVDVEQRSSELGFTGADGSSGQGQPLALDQYVDVCVCAEVPPPCLGLVVRDENDEVVATPGVLSGRGELSA